MGLSVTKTSALAHSYTLSANTGRNQKTFKSRVQTSASGNNNTADTTYIQAGKDEFIQLVSASTRSIGKNDTSLVIELKSNSTKVNATFLANSLDASIASMTINGNAYTNNSTISGDPGADAEYTVLITLSFKANTLASTRAVQLQIADASGHAVTTTGTQEADSPSISVNPSSVSVPAAGGTGTIMVTSNDTWTVSVLNSGNQIQEENPQS